MRSLPELLSETEIKIVATDLDGTLLRPNRTLSPRTIEALDAIHAAGIDLVLATGRPPGFTLSILDMVPTAIGCVCANGAAILDPTTRELSSTSLIGSKLPAILTALREGVSGIGIAVNWEMDFAFDTAFGKALPPRLATGEPLEDIEQTLHNPIYKLLVAHSEIDGLELQSQVQLALGPLAEASHSGYGFIEITASGVDKSTALAAICSERGIGREQIIAFGDMHNDLRMIEWAGIGVAMGNADQAVKDAADYVGAPNVEHGVALVLEQLL